MSRSPHATQPYFRNKVSPLHQYNRTETFLYNNTQSIGYKKNIPTYNEIK